ncbi:NAD(P)/FAD-dependent oxidoreductase [Zunongwangia sp.]|uniref:NAD(P)/FAD-dependent oxidoreductase n=1 Tax=Zunongwangia sp. TaxID=1965325 RepID=UPI003AA89DE3
MYDYIVVGFGLSGLCIAEQLEKKERSFLVFEDNSLTSSKVAGGIYNPVILKRFTLAWEADKQLKYAIPFYKALEEKFSTAFLQSFSIHRRFHSVEEQNQWFEATDKPRLTPFLSPQLVKDLNSNIKNEFSFGKVQQTGALATEKLIDTYASYLQEKKQLEYSSFDYNQLELLENSVIYKGIEAKNIIFCDGFNITKNPYFDYLPIRGNKGEYIIIKSPQLQLKQAVKSSVFIIPLGNDLYKIGATYNHQDKTQNPTQNAKEKLEKQLSEVVKCDFEVVDQVAGIRPATKDRRPMLGKHPKHNSLFVCNGFGSRGVLIAPLISEQLLNFIEEDIPLSPEIDIDRFTKKHFQNA